jgi:hypothetical protein
MRADGTADEDDRQTLTGAGLLSFVVLIALGVQGLERSTAATDARIEAMQDSLAVSVGQECGPAAERQFNKQAEGYRAPYSRGGPSIENATEGQYASIASAMIGVCNQRR